MPRPPNDLVILSDEWRAQAFGFAGDPNARTPVHDRLAATSWAFATAVSNCPVCCPIRASLLTGLYPDRHGVLLNDVSIDPATPSLATAFAAAGYRTGYIGKWHIDGRGRQAFIPRSRRLGFDHWQANECSHDYNRSIYYHGDDARPRYWRGYDADDQTAAMIDFIASASDRSQPWMGVLAWGPPHFPHETAPEAHRARFSPERLTLRPNVPIGVERKFRQELAGYYAHGSALDDCLGRILDHLSATGADRDTLVIVTSDHGDMLGSHGVNYKQRPWDESILVPLLIRPPSSWPWAPRRIAEPVGLIDLLPTLCGLAEVEAPAQIQGRDWSPWLRQGDALPDEPQLIACYAPFADFERRQGGCEYRGIRTADTTYARTLEGPWLLYDNAADPYQQCNLIGADRERQSRAEQLLQALLSRIDDGFLPGDAYLHHWGWPVDAHGTVPYHHAISR